MNENELIFQSLLEKYHLFAENKEVWDKFQAELETETSIDKISNMEIFIENLNIKIEKQLLEQKGFTQISEEVIKIHIDFTNSERINRFTLAHELAHIMFDFKRLMAGEKINSNYMENEIFHDESEVRANNFAAELLMPHKVIIKEIKAMFEEKSSSTQTNDVTLTTDEVIPKIMEVCNVSYSAVQNRLKNMGLVKQ